MNFGNSSKNSFPFPQKTQQQQRPPPQIPFQQQNASRNQISWQQQSQQQPNQQQTFRNQYSYSSQSQPKQTKIDSENYAKQEANYNSSQALSRPSRSYTSQETVPPISYATMNTYLGSTVRVVGRVLGVESGTAKLQMCDGGELVVKITNPQYYQCTFVEVTGRLNRDNTLQEYTVIQFNDEFDMEFYNKGLDISKKFPGIFHESDTKDIKGF
ncbi:73_t:CDS:2 [Ambispora leptoticha]|uniref:73_t:CDS:1 n=1 Tax=Ambispora leptoticha TaxID=144679 RepID=A0A9N9A8J2_9GLOM|nr:73_t:CDS:2 [Ambispora leptoticha]